MEFVEFIRTPKVDDVTLYQANTPPVEGTLCITGHHLILSSRQDNKEELWLLHRKVDSVEKKLSGSQGMITLKCKDFQIVQLEFQRAEDCINIAMSIEALSNVDKVTYAYPFYYRAMFEIMEDGWQAFSPEIEFSRVKAFSEEWRLSGVNKNFDVCSSYPAQVVVPRSIDDDTIVKSAAFRQGGRFPVLSYYHKHNGTVIMRCGQPLTGPNGKRCKEDERLVNACLGIGRRGYILDTRSTNITKLATAKGGGMEPEVHYSQWRHIHNSIARYTSFHESLVKLIEACFDTGCSMDKWLSKLDSSNWLENIKDIITAAATVAQCLQEEGASVLIHGTEGTDSTLMVTALAQLILDPDTRTIRGFEALVEREWLQAGHPFFDRCAKSAFATTKQKQEAPTFLLFLDCVWQIWRQFPLSFEFNEKFLLMLFEHAYSSQYGTFLCNNDMERKRLGLAKKTVSLWSFLNRPKELPDYMNPLYEPNSAVIWPSVAAQSLEVWGGMYQRWQKYQPNQAAVWEEITRIKTNDKEVKSKVVRMRKQLATLEKEAIEQGFVPPPQLPLRQ